MPNPPENAITAESGAQERTRGLERLRAFDSSAQSLDAGALHAVFLPGYGMLGASLCYQDEELLGRVDNIESFALAGKVCGIPLVHPWANRLDGAHYKVAGQAVSLDRSSSLIYHDDNGLPMHGVPWSHLAWQVTGHTSNTLEANLDWTAKKLLAVFPFPHQLNMAVRLDPNGLTVETTLVAGPSGPVPVSFGFHPYFSLAGLQRSEWQVHLPAMQRLLHDERKIPTGQMAAFPMLDSKLGDLDLDDGFFLLNEQSPLSVTGRRRRITVEYIEGYPYAQVFAPTGKDYVAFEPMTAPANALITGLGLRLIEPGGLFRATFRIGVEPLP